MSKGTKLGVFVLLFVILGIAIIDAGAKRPIDWSKTYDFKDKNPYGLYVFRREIGNILGEDRKISSFGESIYELLDSATIAQAKGKAIVEIVDYTEMDELDVKHFLDFVDKGGEVFISSQYISEILLDSLDIEVDDLNYSIFYPSDEKVSYSTGQDKSKIKLEKVDDFVVFTKLNPATCTILGNLHAKAVDIPNLIKVKHGAGYFYLHTLPEAFTNYHLLAEDSYTYASKILNLIQHKEVLLSDYYFSDYQSTTPLRVILTKPGFMQAWYILLFALAMLLFFKSKREQRAVEVVTPEPNLSKEFAKTIANVYYENGDPGNIVHKKIEYFLFAIRHAYNLETIDLLDEKFIFQLSAKSTVNKDDTYALMELLTVFKQKERFSINDVKYINNKIEDFKNKANL